jgi:hypothetical protein
MKISEEFRVSIIMATEDDIFQQVRQICPIASYCDIRAKDRTVEPGDSHCQATAYQTPFPSNERTSNDTDTLCQMLDNAAHFIGSC